MHCSDVCVPGNQACIGDEVQNIKFFSAQVQDMLHEGALLPVTTLVPPQPFDTMLGPAPLICSPGNAGQSSPCLGLPMSQQLESTLCPMQSE